jgi:hypothetical protein
MDHALIAAPLDTKILMVNAFLVLQTAKLVQKKHVKDAKHHGKFKTENAKKIAMSDITIIMEIVKNAKINAISAKAVLHVINVKEHCL